MNELALFSGAGGGILGGKLLGWTTVAAVEIEKYPREILLQRQRDGILPRFPIWDDIRSFDGRPWRGLVDVVSGGFPCQDISAAGKGANTKGPKSLMEVALTDWKPGQTWPTPQASDYKRANDSVQTCLHRMQNGHQMGLPETVRLRELFPTPTCQDATNNGAKSQQQRNTPPLNAVAGGALNPEWVEWLMGWPIGWTDLSHLEMDRFHWWLRSHSMFLERF